MNDNNNDQCDTCKYSDLEARDEPCASCIFGRDGDVIFTNKHELKEDVGNLETLLKVAQCIDPKASLSCALTNIIYRWKTDQWGHHHNRDFDLNDPNVLFEVINYLQETWLEVRFRKVDGIQWCELIHDSNKQKDLECKGENIKEAIENILEEIFEE